MLVSVCGDAADGGRDERVEGQLQDLSGGDKEGARKGGQAETHVAVVAVDEHAPAVVDRLLDPAHKLDDGARERVERAPVARLDDEARAQALEVVDLVGLGPVSRRAVVVLVGRGV